MKLSNLLKEFNAKDEVELLVMRTKNVQRRQFVTGAPKAVVMTADECKAACEKMQLAYEKGYEERVLRYVTTTEHRDRYGDIVRAAGAKLDNYLRNPVIQFAHDYSNPPVGNTIHIAVDGKNNNVPAHGLFMDERVDASGRSDLIFRMAKSGFMKACSIGFMPIDAYRPADSKEREAMGLGEYGLEYREWDFMEWSPCPVPANPNALQESIKSIGKKKAKGLFTPEDFNLMARFNLFEAPSALDMFVEQLEGRVGKVYLFSPVLDSLLDAAVEAENKDVAKVGPDDQGGDETAQTNAVHLVCVKCGKGFDHEPDAGDSDANEDDKEMGDDQQGEEEKAAWAALSPEEKSNHKTYRVKCADEKCAHEFKVYPKGKSVSVECSECKHVFNYHAAPAKGKDLTAKCPKCDKEMKLDLSLAHKSAHECAREACGKEFVHNHCSMPNSGSNEKHADEKAFPKGAHAKCTACGNHHALVPADLSNSENGEHVQQSVKAVKKSIETNPKVAALIPLLNNDLSLEYSAMVQYIQHAATLTGAQYDHIRKELETHAEEEHGHAVELSNKIEFLGGVPTCFCAMTRTAPDSPTMLMQDAEAEKDAVTRYQARVEQAREAGENGLVDVLLGILAKEEEHLQDIVTSLGIEVAAVQPVPAIAPAAPAPAVAVAPEKSADILNMESDKFKELSAQMETALKAMADDFSATLRGIADEIKSAMPVKRSPFAPENIDLFDEVKL